MLQNPVYRYIFCRRFFGNNRMLHWMFWRRELLFCSQCFSIVCVMTFCVFCEWSWCRNCRWKLGLKWCRLHWFSESYWHIFESQLFFDLWWYDHMYLLTLDIIHNFATVCDIEASFPYLVLHASLNRWYSLLSSDLCRNKYIFWYLIL